MISRKIRTSFLRNKDLVEEIDRMNPFATRREFLHRACKACLLIFSLRYRVLAKVFRRAGFYTPPLCCLSVGRGFIPRHGVAFS